MDLGHFVTVLFPEKGSHDVYRIGSCFGATGHVNPFSSTSWVKGTYIGLPPLQNPQKGAINPMVALPVSAPVEADGCRSMIGGSTRRGSLNLWPIETKI